MPGRLKKKPEYNPELQFNNFLQELRDAYEEADSLRSLADELNISLLKLRKLLITADVFTSDICTEINDLHQSGKKIPEIMKLTGLSRASVHSYLPYTKGLYNAAEISLNAERCRTYKIRQEQVRLLREMPSEENLWQAVIAFQDYPFKTATGLPFWYKLKVGKNGEYGLYAVTTDLLYDDVKDILKVSEGRWEIEECFRIMKTDFEARPVYLQDEIRIKAHFLICFLSLVIYRYLEKSLGNIYTCETILDKLKTMNFADVQEQGFMPLYTRDKLTDTLHSVCGFETDFQFITKSQMKTIQKKSKGRE